MPTFKLVSFHICPFVQRSAITLAHKGVAHETEYVDLADKPEWFLAMSPTGKVPLLVVGDASGETILFESAVINEYLDEVTEGSMLPAEPLERARHRAMIELGSAALGDAWMLAAAKDEDSARGHAAKLRDKLARFEAEFVGPFYSGETLGLVDTAVIPLLQRVAWTNELAPELDLFAGLPKVQGWLAKAQELPAVRASTVDDIDERFKRYFQTRQTWVAQAA